MSPLVLATRQGDLAEIRLNRPERHNSLTPPLMDAFNAALAPLRATPPLMLLLTANGRSFSTGGDIRGFLDTPRGERHAYARGLVGALHRGILDLIDLPCPVVARVQGPVTGGSVGFVLAADLVVMAEPAFIAPYYSEVGFSPDGGWTALMPERIGARRTGAIQMLNRHVSAREALELGLADQVSAPEALDETVARIVRTLAEKSPTSLAATKALLWPVERRRRVEEGLERELALFLDHIERGSTEAGMKRFLEARA